MGQFSLFDTDEFVNDEVFLFFDTETNGLPLRYDAPIEEVDNWPRMLQIAWVQANGAEEELSRGNYLIYPDGFYVMDSIHGITHDKALEEGRPLQEIMEIFQKVLKESNTLVAHNISFDEKIVGAEFVRLQMENALAGMNQICTMKSSVDFCAIPSGNRFKFPTLAELHQKLFNEGFDGAHDAMNDVEALVRAFWGLKKEGVVSIY